MYLFNIFFWFKAKIDYIAKTGSLSFSGGPGHRCSIFCFFQTPVVDWPSVLSLFHLVVDWHSLRCYCCW